jgi:hypothetical protein
MNHKDFRTIRHTLATEKEDFEDSSLSTDALVLHHQFPQRIPLDFCSSSLPLFSRFFNNPSD